MPRAGQNLMAEAVLLAADTLELEPVKPTHELSEAVFKERNQNDS